MTAEFLAFSKAQGNDLSHADAAIRLRRPEAGRPLVPVRRRWKEALDAGAAPQVVLEATHAVTLQVVSLDDLKKYAVRLQ